MTKLPENSSQSGIGTQRPPIASIKVLLADDHAILREGLRMLLQKEQRFTIVGEAGDGRQAVDQVLQLRPDVVVMDIAMPGLNGVDATCQLKVQSPQTKVIALSMYSQKSLIKRMLQAGARGFLLKSCAGKDLVAAIDCAMANQFYFSAAIVEQVSDVFRSLKQPASETAAAELDAKQHHLLQLLAEGKNTKQIAERMHLSPKTVDVYRRRLMNQLRLWSIAELTKYAIRKGVTSVDSGS